MQLIVLWGYETMMMNADTRVESYLLLMDVRRWSTTANQLIINSIIYLKKLH